MDDELTSLNFSNLAEILFTSRNWKYPHLKDRRKLDFKIKKLNDHSITQNFPVEGKNLKNFYSNQERKKLIR